MQKLKSLVVNVLTVAASLAVTLLAIELILRLLPIAWAPPVEPPTADNPIQRYAASRAFTWSLGWNLQNVVHGRSNAQGFVADYDYDPAATTPLVAVVGDSYVEALQVPFAQSLTGRLQAMLGRNGRAYAFAQSGAPLSQYVAYAAHACAAYRPQRLVVVIVGNDFDESIFAHRGRDGLFHLYPGPDGGFAHKLTALPPPRLTEQILRRSALALYLARNVGVSNVLALFRPAQVRAQGGYVGNTTASADAARLDDGRRVIAWFLDALPRASCLAPRDIVLAVDAPRPDLYEPAALAASATSYFGQMRSRLIADARAGGFGVVDMQAAFLAAYAADGERFEFWNDGHWNAHGHEVVAKAVREALAGWPPLQAGEAQLRRPN